MPLKFKLKKFFEYGNTLNLALKHYDSLSSYSETGGNSTIKIHSRIFM